ncbi:MAG: hypothetical protein ACXWX9_06665 [Actinomycetota bacterium]
MSGRRLLVLLVVLAAIGIPAGILQATCVGRSCDEAEEPSRVPFCPLPATLKGLIANGYREGRSPDVLAVTRDVPVYTESGGTGVRAPWPALGSSSDARVPIVFSGTGVSPGTPVPAGTTLDRIAPTVSDVIGFERPFPEVRSGTAVEGVANGERPELVLLVAWKWIGSEELEAFPDDWPFLASLLDEGAGTLDGETGSLPLDPTATITTIGAGGLPSQHGVTGSFVRNEQGQVVPAFGDGAPVPVIATLADDLDETTDQRSVVSLVAADELDRGLIGGEWYAESDSDTVVIADGDDAVAAAGSMLRPDVGGRDTDVLGVTLEGSVRSMDRRTQRIVAAAHAATDGSVLVVVAGTGTWERARVAVADDELVDAVEAAVPGNDAAVAASVPGGLFLDQDVLTRAAVTGQVAVDALLGVTDRQDREMMADAFQGFAVSFARYC